MSVVIEKCLDRAMPLTPVESDKLDAEARILTSKKELLLGVEIRAKSAIDQRLSEINVLKEQQRVAEAIDFAPRIDPIVFSWRQKKPIKHRRCEIPAPSLVLYGLGKPNAVISGNKWGITFDPDIPNFVRPQYADVSGAVSSCCAKRRLESLKMTTAFDGVIPDATRAKIKEAHDSGTFEKMYLLSEADRWNVSSVEEPPPPRTLDPIVVGLRADALWVIDVFDPTTVESYVASEFTT